MLKARLTDCEVDCVFQKNLELMRIPHQWYGPGHLSVHAMWNMSGVLDLERRLFSGTAESNTSSPKKVKGSLILKFILFSSFLI